MVGGWRKSLTLGQPSGQQGPSAGEWLSDRAPKNSYLTCTSLLFSLLLLSLGIHFPPRGDSFLDDTDILADLSKTRQVLFDVKGNGIDTALEKSEMK